MAAADAGKFGNCCEHLKDAMGGEDFEPLISVDDDDGVLYLSVGLIEAEEDEPNMIDHPIFFCPFCGTKLQSEEEVDAKINAAGGAN